MEPKLEPFWMALVPRRDRALTVAAFDLCKQKAESSARERRRSRCAGVVHQRPRRGEQFAAKISLWFGRARYRGAENTKLRSRDRFGPQENDRQDVQT